MDLHDARFLVAGATGALGSRLARALHNEGARVFVAGRDADRLRALADELGVPSGSLDLTAPKMAVEAAVTALGGLDGLVIATGTVAFGAAGELPDDIAQELFAVNALGPIALVRAAPEGLASIVALSAVVAEFPTAGMAAYSASKAALSAYLAALRRERRRDGLTVLDVRPPHLDTAFSDHALHGEPPRLPEPADPDTLVSAIIEAMRTDRRELRYDPMKRELIAH